MIFLAPSFDPRNLGGIERVSRQILEAARLGAFGPGPHLALCANDEEDPHPGGPVPIKNYGCRYPAMILDAFRMPLKRLAGPVLCLHAGLSPAARLIARRLKTPCFVFLHGVEVWRELPLRTRWGLAGASRFLANSAYTLGRFQAWHPRFAATASLVTPLGLSRSFQEAKEERVPAIPESGGFILTVSRLSSQDAYKGHETLIDSVQHLRREGSGAFLVVVGSGDASVELHARVSRSKDRQAVQFLGRVSDAQLLWLYRRCAAFALLSEGEGFGLVHLEAMSQGKPCVATNADAASEVVDDRVTGRLVPPRDAKSAAAALAEILGDASLARQWGEAGRRKVEASFLESHFIGRLGLALKS